MPYAPSRFPLVSMPTPADPLSSLSNLMAVGTTLENWSEHRRQRDQQKRVDTALNEAQGDYGKAAEILGRQGMWELAKPLEEKAIEVRQQERQRRHQEFGQMLERADALPSKFGKAETLLNEVTPETYARAVPVLRELATSIHPDLAAHIPEQYDLNQVDQMRQSVGVLKQKATRIADGLKQFLPDGDPLKGLTTLLEVADTDEEREQIAERAAYFEMPQAQIAVAQRLAKASREKATRDALPTAGSKEDIYQSYSSEFLRGVPWHQMSATQKADAETWWQQQTGTGRGGNSDYSRYLSRWAIDRGLDLESLTSAQELEARNAFFASSGTRRTSAQGDKPTFPRGVEDYLVDMRRRGYAREKAEAEVFSDATWAQLRRDHPRLSAIEVQQAITRLFPEQGGDVGAGRGGRIFGTQPEEASQPPARTGGPGPTPSARTATTADVQAVADRAGITFAEARRRLEASGVQVR